MWMLAANTTVTNSCGHCCSI